MILLGESLANERAEPDLPPIYGALCGVLPDYSSEEVLWSEIRIHIRRGGLIPSVEIHDSSHPLYSLQQEGATLEYWHQVVGSLMPELAARYGIGST